jgi:hypothetical protein
MEVEVVDPVADPGGPPRPRPPIGSMHVFFYIVSPIVPWN